MVKVLVGVIILILCSSVFVVHLQLVNATESGLVGYWTFDEGSGTTTYDSSGNGNTGTIHGAVWVDGAIGKALQFNGINNYVSIPQSSSLDISGSQVSVEYWIKLPSPWQAGASSVNLDQILYDKGDAYTAAMISGSGALRFNIPYVMPYPETNKNNWNSNTWYHIANVFDGSQIRIYINGNLDKTETVVGSVSRSSINLAIGSHCYGDKNFFNGAIDEFKIYNYARTSQQITEDYNEAASTSTQTKNSLVGYWKFDEGSGTVAHDSSGNGNDGTIYTAAWTDGVGSKALHFNGVDSWVRIPNNPSLTTLNQITLEAWIRLDNFNSRPVGLISKCDGGAPPVNAEYFLGTMNQNAFFETDHSTAIFSAQSQGGIDQTGVWYLVAGTWSGSTYAIYINGVQVASGSCTPQTTLGNLLDVQIGRHGTWSWTYFSGTIDEVKIYNYARTAQDIQNDYTQNNQDNNKRTINIAVIPAMFSDNNPSPTFDSNFYLYSTDFITDLKQYYTDISYRQVQLNFDFFTNPDGSWKYSLDHDRLFYGSGVGNSPSDLGNKEKEFTVDCVAKANSNVDFGSYDIAIFLHPGDDEASNPIQNKNDMWSCHFSQNYISQDGEVVKNRIVLAEYDVMGTWAHEIGHALGDLLEGQYLPDRYTNSGNGEVYAWDLMGSGNLKIPPSQMSVFSKAFLGWVNPRVKGYGTYTMNSIETLSAEDSSNTIIFYPGGLSFRQGNIYYLLESRTSALSNNNWQNRWEAPDSGAVLYEVTTSLLQPDFSNGAHVDKITLVSQSPAMATLRSTGDSYVDPFALVKFSYVNKESRTSGYYSTVEISSWTPIDLVGTILSQNIPELGSLAVGPNSSLVPDLDLHSYAVDGRHIGMNYVTGEYENQIEGAIASGDLSGANEWIFVPQGVKVSYSVSSKDIGDYLQAFPSLEEKYSQISFNVTYSSFDNSGNQRVLGKEKSTIAPDSTVQLNPSGSDSESTIFDRISELISNPLLVIVGVLIVIIVFVIVVVFHKRKSEKARQKLPPPPPPLLTR